MKNTLGVMLTSGWEGSCLPVKVFSSFEEGTKILNDINKKYLEEKGIFLNERDVATERKMHGLNPKGKCIMLKWDFEVEKLCKELFTGYFLGHGTLQDLILLEYIPGDKICSFSLET